MQDCDPPLRKVQHRRWAHIPSAFCPKVLLRPEFEEVEVKLEDGGITEMRWWRLEFSQLVQHGISPERELWRDKFQKSLWFFFLQTFCHELRYVCIQDPIKYSRKWLMMGREPKANTSSHTMLVKVGYFNQLEQRDLTASPSPPSPPACLPSRAISPASQHQQERWDCPCGCRAVRPPGQATNSHGHHLHPSRTLLPLQAPRPPLPWHRQQLFFPLSLVTPRVSLLCSPQEEALNRRRTLQHVVAEGTWTLVSGLDLGKSLTFGLWQLVHSDDEDGGHDGCDCVWHFGGA